MHHKLQAVPIKIVKIDTVRVPRTATDLHPVFLQFSLDLIVFPRRNVEGQMVHIVACGKRRAVTLGEQGYSLVPAVHKGLFRVFPVDGHTQQLSIELLGARHILHVQDDMVDTTDLYHSAFLPLPCPKRATASYEVAKIWRIGRESGRTPASQSPRV